jgi:hypothetical protein
MNSLCPGCAQPAPEPHSVCRHCGRTLRPAASSDSQRRLLTEFHRALLSAVEQAGDPGSAEQARERFLHNGFIPDDPRLLEEEAWRCRGEVEGAADVSGAWWIRYQACVVRLDRREAERSERAAREQRAARAQAEVREVRRRAQARLTGAAVILAALFVITLIAAVVRHLLLLHRA